MFRITIINGPNLNLLGTREPEIYGKKRLDDINNDIEKSFPNVHFDFFQSNCEGKLIDIIQEAQHSADGIIINPGAYSHYSIAIRDALKAVSIPAIEVHLSNIASREEFRQTSITTAVCAGVISGFGHFGYQLAVKATLHQISAKKD